MHPKDLCPQCHSRLKQRRSRMCRPCSQVESTERIIQYGHFENAKYTTVAAKASIKSRGLLGFDDLSVEEKDWMAQSYVRDDWTMTRLAAYFHTTRDSIRNWLTKLGVKTRGKSKKHLFRYTIARQKVYVN